MLPFVTRCQRILQRNITHRLITFWTLALVILFLWEILKLSIAFTDETSNSLVSSFQCNFKTQRDCIRPRSQQDSLVLSALMTLKLTSQFSSGQGDQYVLKVDVLVQSENYEGWTIFPAGTPVRFGEGTLLPLAAIGPVSKNEVEKIDYMEYSDYYTNNKAISLKKEENISSVSNNTKLLLESNFHTTSNVKLINRHESFVPDNRIIDVMLVEDEMLRIHPRDQILQKEISELIRKRLELTLLLQKKRRQLMTKTQRKQLAKESPASYNWHPAENVLSTGADPPNQVAPVSHPWLGLISDESSEPLYSEGFLDRVQKAKLLLNRQPSLFKRIQENDMSYLLNTQRVCTERERVDMVYLIHSKPENTELRQRYRKTIVYFNAPPASFIVSIFLVGKPTDLKTQMDLTAESEVYKDIVQGNFTDTPEKTLLKGLMGMRWVLQFCKRVSMILKIDDDVLVDSQRLMTDFLTQTRGILGKRAMFCDLNAGSSFENNPVQRPYCYGHAVLMTRHALCSVLAASHQIRVSAAEDYFLYGVLPYLVGNVEVYNFSGSFGFQRSPTEAIRCFSDQAESCPILTTRTSAETFFNLWNAFRMRLLKVQHWNHRWNFQSVKNYFS